MSLGFALTYNSILFNSGASHNFFNNKKRFTTYTSYNPIAINIGG